MKKFVRLFIICLALIICFTVFFACAPNKDTSDDTPNDAPTLLSFGVASLNSASASGFAAAASLQETELHTANPILSENMAIAPTAYKTIPSETYYDLPELTNFDLGCKSFLPGAKVDLEIKIVNSEGYSISRFKINQTAFTSGSFTTKPMEIGSVTTTIILENVTLPDSDVVYTITDIKYIAELNMSEKNVNIPEQVQSVTVDIVENGNLETSGVRYRVYQNEIYVHGHQCIYNKESWNAWVLTNEKVSLKIPAQIDGKNVVSVDFNNDNMLTDLDIPETVERLRLYVIYGPLKTLTMRMVVPPEVESAFDCYIGGEAYQGGPAIPEGLKIYVPAGSVEAYKNAVGWGEFADIIFAIEE